MHGLYGSIETQREEEIDRARGGEGGGGVVNRIK